MTTLLVGGLLIGIGWMHGLRLITEEDSPSRRVVARSGFILYVLAGVFCVLPFFVLKLVGLVVAIVGPLIGFSAVLLTGNKPDSFQIYVGWLQAITLVLACVELARLLELYS